ncbi:unnamed protein product, partial [Bubo scandiacus]
MICAAGTAMAAHGVEALALQGVTEKAGGSSSAFPLTRPASAAREPQPHRTSAMGENNSQACQ